ncbi:MAG: hypothetical protein NV1_13 [Nanoarchaeotal virus 1]|nr:MAG: hypothetical protein NV1_13 [Nanoarchaeotal virus 1]
MKREQSSRRTEKKAHGDPKIKVPTFAYYKKPTESFYQNVPR